MAGDFWLSSGHLLLDRTPEGRLEVTDDFLRAYLARPEIGPVEESCAEELALHRALLANPRLEVGAERLAALADADARENYEVWLGFRDVLVSRPTLEEGYLALVHGGTGRVPALFLDQLVHVILRTMLEGVGEPMRARAAELLFRSQRVNIQDGAVLVADEDTVDERSRDGGFGGLGRLLAESGTGVRGVDLDVMTEGNSGEYWARSDRFDMVLEVGFPKPGLDALCRVLEHWVRHLLGVVVRIHPVQQISDERWSWHVGLDTEATGIMNALYNGEEVGAERLARVLALFRLEFDDPGVMLDRVAGRPVYMAMAMTADRKLRLKPQKSARQSADCGELRVVALQGERMMVGVVVEHRRIDHPWQSHRWQPVDVLPGEPAAAAWTVLGQGEGGFAIWLGRRSCRCFRGSARLTPIIFRAGSPPYTLC